MTLNNSALFENLEKIAPLSVVKINEPLKLHTTFKVGGEADVFIEVANVDEASEIIKYLNLIGYDYYVLGKGSNILVGDKGYRGVIISLNSLRDISVDGDVISVSAGVNLSRIANVALENSLTGMEFASGIPGSLGGALTMNAGAYGGEMKDIVESVEVIAQDGSIYTLSNEEMLFGYRDSIIKHQKLLCVSAVIRLNKGDKEAISERMSELNNARKEKQPLEYPSAGSTFKRPEGYFAGKLIMDAGLSGYTIGGAQVSKKHCGFIINTGNATAEDIKDLIDEVTEKVYDRFKVLLEPEVCMLGEF